MKYKYFYQTKTNENREGEIRAANRAEAYAALRKQGIRPYRVVGDDPLPWRPVVWAVLPILTAVAAFFIGVRFFSARPSVPMRHQIEGDRALIFDGERNHWKDCLTTPLDRYLAAYAQPGGEARPPLLASTEIAGLVRDLEKPEPSPKNCGEEVRQLCAIIGCMRAEMRAYLSAGHNVGEYLEFLETRQREERAFRARAVEKLESAPANLRYELWKNLNARLVERGLEQLPVPADLLSE